MAETHTIRARSEAHVRASSGGGDQTASTDTTAFPPNCFLRVRSGNKARESMITRKRVPRKETRFSCQNRTNVAVPHHTLTPAAEKTSKLTNYPLSLFTNRRRRTSVICACAVLKYRLRFSQKQNEKKNTFSASFLSFSYLFSSSYGRHDLLHFFFSPPARGKEL